MTVASVQFTGYHGTTQSFADQIIAESSFVESTKSNEWLGHGVYFFDEREYAEWWGNDQAKRHGEEIYAVISALITCPNDAYLDLDTLTGFYAVENCYKMYLAQGMFKKGAPTFNDEKELQCFAIELYKRSHPEIKLIAYTFDSTKRTRIGLKPKQRQYCVCDQSIIGDVKIAQKSMVNKGGNYA